MASKKFEKTKPLEAFKEECYLIDFVREYGPNHGMDAPWGFATDLSRPEIEDRYADIISHFNYRPYVVLEKRIATPFAAYKRNERKHERRNNLDDAYGINENSEAFHPELTYTMESREIGLHEQAAIRTVYANRSILTPKQQRVFHLYFDLALSCEQIAERIGSSRQGAQALVDRMNDRIHRFMANEI